MKRHRVLPIDPLSLPQTDSTSEPPQPLPLQETVQQLDDKALLDGAQALIFNQLKFMLERDIMERVLQKEVENLYAEREKKRREEMGGVDNVMKTLSFKKPKKNKEKDSAKAKAKKGKDGERWTKEEGKKKKKKLYE